MIQVRHYQKQVKIILNIAKKQRQYRSRTNKESRRSIVQYENNCLTENMNAQENYFVKMCHKCINCVAKHFVGEKGTYRGINSFNEFIQRPNSASK